MNKNKISVWAFACTLLVTGCIISCRKEKDPTYGSDSTKGYFPIEIGKYVLYDVDSTLYDDFNCATQVVKYQMRYDITDTFRDNQDRLSYMVQARIKAKDETNWKPGTVFYITPTENRLEWIQSNLRYIKLVFPVQNGYVWQGNSMLPGEDPDYQLYTGWKYTYDQLGASYRVDDTHVYDNTVTVNQVDEAQNNPETTPDAYAYKLFSKEVYAYHVGLVYREMTHWIYDPGVVKCRKGYSVQMRAIEHN